MKRRHGIAPWLLVWLAAACTPLEVQERCDRLCSALDTCGLLPSPLGAEVEGASVGDNCRARCANTPVLSETIADRAFAALTRLRDAGADEGIEKLWCASSETEPPMCLALADVVQSVFAGSDRILGHASLKLSPVRDGEMAFGSQLCEVDPDRPGPLACCRSVEEATGEKPFRDPRGHCEALGEPQVTFFAEQDGLRRAAEPISCDEAFKHGGHLPPLSAGLTVGGVRLEGEIPRTQQERCTEGGDNCTPYCLVFYTPAIVLHADQSAETSIRLPTLEEFRKQSLTVGWASCEGDAVSCADGLDNDHDGDVDCADVECEDRRSCRELDEADR